MISFSKLGEYGRFGNQLFQYAFLRSQAKRLGVQFYCQKWKGEEVFLLNESNEKSVTCDFNFTYREDPYKHGFNTDFLNLKDSTDIEGYFQSYKFFKKEDVFHWFTFNSNSFSSCREKYKAIDFDDATALHIRLGDYLYPSLMFYAPKESYFKKAIKILKPKGDILVFSEDIDIAKKYLGEMPSNTIFIEGNSSEEDFYLMTLCKDIIISSSSFSWWAAYLNRNNNKKVIMPKDWFLPFCPIKNNDIFVEGWIKLSASRVFLDNYYIRYIVIKLKTFVC